MDEKQKLDPSEVRALNDPGDETQRNFRYQHAYGAILLILAANGKKNYKAVWCEHHEDLLAECEDSSYEAFQIKTRQPELGYWKLNDDEIINSIKRFVRFDGLFGEKMRLFVIVSNTKFLDCGDDVKEETLKKSPTKLIQAVKDAPSYGEIKKPFLDVLSHLSKTLKCNMENLYNILKRTFLVVGPSREAFDAEISHNHLTALEVCQNMRKASLNAIRDEIIQQVYKASSLYVEDPEVYLYYLKQGDSAIIKAKRVSVEIVLACIQQSKELLFRYQPVDLKIQIDQTPSETHVLENKFIKGNIRDHIQTMKRRMLSAESRLLEMNGYSPETFSTILAQLESVVQSECDEAALAAQLDKGNSEDPYGPLMLKTLFERLRKLAKEQPGMIYNEPYETLVGIAGLLSENCSVWWSKKFDIKGAA